MQHEAAKGSEPELFSQHSTKCSEKSAASRAAASDNFCLLLCATALLSAYLLLQMSSTALSEPSSSKMPQRSLIVQLTLME
jgi:type VI protein secretion system component VasF